MGDDKVTANGEAAGGHPSASSVIESVKLDFNTIKLILMTAVAVVALLTVPLFFVFRNFVTFDALDNYFKVTESVQPKILHNIAEDLDSGYSRNFIFEATRDTDSTLLFYAPRHQKVTISVNAQAIGAFPPVALYLNNCLVESRKETFNFYEKDVTDKLESCVPDEPNLNTLRIALPEGLPKSTTLQISCLILVNNRIHAHLEDVKK